MENSVRVVKKSWLDNSTNIETITYNCQDSSSGDKMYNKILRQLQYNNNRREYVKVSLIENSAVRLTQLFNPTKIVPKIEKQPIIKRKELWNNVKN